MKVCGLSLLGKKRLMAASNSEGTKLAVFKGIKADLTQAILRILSEEVLIKYDIHLKLKKQGFTDTHYGTVKKRITALEKDGYIKQAGVRKTQPGSEGILYEATFKGLAALKLRSTNLDQLFLYMDEESALELLAALARVEKK
jgi:DNA-binding PadR family transcriptional regulator